jgi:hypothetical protein
LRLGQHEIAQPVGGGLDERSAAAPQRAFGLLG